MLEHEGRLVPDRRAATPTLLRLAGTAAPPACAAPGQLATHRRTASSTNSLMSCITWSTHNWCSAPDHRVVSNVGYSGERSVTTTLGIKP